jgi:hypothetical protein
MVQNILILMLYRSWRLCSPVQDGAIQANPISSIYLPMSTRVNFWLLRQAGRFLLHQNISLLRKVWNPASNLFLFGVFYSLYGFSDDAMFMFASKCTKEKRIKKSQGDAFRTG